MKAVILAGGKGTRLKPYTTLLPKPLVPVGEKAILQILLERLIKCGVDEVFICVNHMADIIKAFFGDGEKFGIKIRYSHEEKPLSTVAPIKLIEGLPDDFLVMNGDLLTDLDFTDLYRFHQEKQSLLTVAAYHRKTKIDFGVIEVDDQSLTAKAFREKPEYDFHVSMGVYAMKKEILEMVPYNEPFGFDNLMYTMLEKNKPVSIYNYEGYWLDIGRPDDYEKACNDIEILREKLK